MALPYTLTAEFAEAVDHLVQDVAVPDSTLQSRAQRCLEIFDEKNTVQVKRSPSWVERIRKPSSNHPHPFTTPDFFNLMCLAADELDLAAGRRYVSAAICVCGEHVARAGAAVDTNPEQRAAELAQALHQLSSTWVAFLLWPFYAYGNEYREIEKDDLPPSSGDETPTAESIARAHRHRWKQQVMARDDYRCFMSGGLDMRAYFAGRPIPAGARLVCCSTVPIIPPEVWAHDSPGQSCGVQSDQEITLGILTRFFALDDATLAEKTSAGPQNSLYVNGSVDRTFSQLMWCLHPTETPDRYEIESYMDPFCEHVTTHVTFVDHSESGVDLPDRELLRMHAALAGVLHRSGADDLLGYLRFHHDVGRAVYPGPTGSAFWKSVIAYEGPEVCLEVELWEAAEALRDATGASPHATPQ